MNKTPPNALAGYHMPAEWERHEATWLAWPHYQPDWPGKLEAVEWAFGEIIRKLSRHEKVCVLVDSLRQQTRVDQLLRLTGVERRRIRFFPVKTDRAWIRDSGPIFLKKRGTHRLGAAIFRFNAWAHYPNWMHDMRVSKKVATLTGATAFEIVEHGRRFVLEGGSIDVNGNGCLLTTEECLLDQRRQVRNPGLSKDKVEIVLKRAFGIHTVIWLGKGIAGDDTHGHVDDICRFVDSRTIVYCDENNPHDVNFPALKDNVSRLRRFRFSDGSRPRLIALPMPAPLYHGHLRLPASYANFYIANKSVLVPTFNDSNDRLALGILSELFPGREVVGIHAVDLVRGFGTIHCLTQQQPSA